MAAKAPDISQKLQVRINDRRKSPIKKIMANWDLYLLYLPVLVYFLVFHYFPMYGIQIAFKSFVPSKGILGSPWVGFVHFIRFFDSYYFWRLIKNTLGINIYHLAVGFPAPIILALMMNECVSKAYKKTVQMVTYAPHFLSTVVVVGMLASFLSPNTGFINQLIVQMGGKPVFFMAEPGWFKTIFVFSGIWQNTGWASIVYMAALAGIDIQQYEAAEVDGATKLQKIWHITLPGIMPTAIILLILNAGKVMNVGFEKVFLMQNNVNMEASDVISTYVYRNGILGAKYSFSAAVGLFNSVVNIILVLFVNKLARRYSETSLW